MLLKDHKGFFLAELLLSLAAFLIIATFLLPILLHMYNERLQFQLHREATQFLYEQLITAEVEQKSVPSQIWIKNGQQYEIFTRDSSDEGGEVCVRFANMGQSIEVCETRQ